MIPILSDSPTLQGNGLGGLSDAIECVVTDEVNGEYELRMCYPVTGEHYGEIQNNLIIFAEPMALATAQPFRIYRITKPLNGVVTIYARHLAYDMSGIVVKPFSALSLTAALSAVPTYSVPACPFTLTSTRTITSKMEIDEPRPLWTLLGGSAGSFLDVYGGEWEFDGYTATLKTKLGENRGVVIRYGKNLTELENDSDLSSTYGGVFPYWYDEEEGLVTITEGYVPVTGSIYTRILLLDCSSDFDEKPTEAQLRTKAQNYIDNNSVGSPNDSWKVSFAQLAQAGEYETQALLEEVQLGDTVSVIYEALGVNASARVVKTEWDVLGDKYKAVTIGRVKQNLASILVGQNKETERAISQTKSALERAISSATDFIKHGTGVMRFIYNEDGDLMEIVSLDNADLSQAQSVWRWNQGGFGHSSTGYNGTYTTAITQDGQIVADFITAGTLSGNRVRTGLIEDETGTNYWNLDTGEFHSQTLENAISQTEEGISLVSEKLNNIGGRNYLWAADKNIHPATTYQNCTLAYDPDNNGEYVLTGGSANAFQQAYYGPTGQSGYLCPDELKGETVTLHADYISATGANPSPRFYVECVDANHVHIGSAYYWVEPNNLSLTFTIPANTVYIFPMPRVRQTGTFISGEVATFRGVKLEKGEVATDWTPAPEDGQAQVTSVKNEVTVNAEGITLLSQKVDNIGGRNYLRYSNDTSEWYAYTPTNYRTAQIGMYTNMVGGKTYTITIWGEVPTRDGVNGCYCVYWGGGATPVTEDSGAVRLTNGKGSLTFTAPTSGQGTANLWLDIYNTVNATPGSQSTYTGAITAMKLEEGEVSTDWSAAPEDKTGNNEIISKINVSPENIVISASKVDLQGYVTFSNLSTSGQTAINGANITTGLIQDQARKNSWNLNTGALTITDGSINITTSSSTNDVIKLSYGNYSTEYTASSVTAAETRNGSYASKYVLGTSSLELFDKDNVPIVSLYSAAYSPSSGGCGNISLYKNRSDYTPSITIFNYARTHATGDTFATYEGDNLSFSEWVSATSGTTVALFGTRGMYVAPTSNAHRPIELMANTDWTGAHLSLGDGSSSYTRTSLTNSGLTFSNSSGNVTASYPATGWETTELSITATVGTAWADTGLTYTIPSTGWYIFRGIQYYNNISPRGVMLGFITPSNGYLYPMAVTENTDGIIGTQTGKTVAGLYTSACMYLTAGWVVHLYAKAAGSSTNGCFLTAHGPIA